MELLTRNDLPKLITAESPNIIEIGVEWGGFTDLYYPQLSKNAHLWLLDLWQTEGNDFYFSTLQGQVEKGYDRVQKLYGTKDNVTLVKGSSFENHEEFPDNFFDWIYIDADHSYNGIKTNIEKWYPKLKKGGIFSGHDYDPDPRNVVYDHFSINKVVNEIFPGKFSLTNESYYKSWYFIK